MFGATRRAQETADRAVDLARSSTASNVAHELVCTQRWEEAKRVWDSTKTEVQELRRGITEVATINSQENSAIKWWIIGVLLSVIAGVGATVASFLLK